MQLEFRPKEGGRRFQPRGQDFTPAHDLLQQVWNDGDWTLNATEVVDSMWRPWMSKVALRLGRGDFPLLHELVITKTLSAVVEKHSKNTTSSCSVEAHMKRELENLEAFKGPATFSAEFVQQQGVIIVAHH